MKIATTLIYLFFVIGLAGCQSEQDSPEEVATPRVEPAESTQLLRTPRVQQQTFSLLQEPLEPVLLENPAQALGYWQEYRVIQPTLILLSNDPFLQPLPPQTAEQILSDMASASRQELVTRATSRISNPLLIPTMAISAALRQQLFSNIIWELPLDTSVEKLSKTTLRSQLLGYGAISADEASSIEYDNGVFSGRIRDTPFQARHPQAMSPVTGPVIVHIDLSYFAPLYKGEIETPLYPLIYRTLDKLRKQKAQVLAVTISYSNQNDNLPLSTRFIGPDLATIFQQPVLLNKEIPSLWKQRTNILYLPNFFQSTKVNELLQDMVKSAPDQPSINFAFYQALRAQKRGDVALNYLAKAVTLDRGYALEYLLLASLARQNNLLDKALEMLQLAAVSFPDDPFILIQRIGLLQELSQIDEAQTVLKQLEGLDWSEIFYPRWPAKLDELKIQLAQ